MHTILCSTHFLFLIIIFVFVDSQPLSLHDNKKFQDCSIPFECGQTILAYPFWGNRRIQDCGRPDFELKCQDSSTLIEINSENYSVLPIKPDQMLILQMNIFDSCPEPFNDLLGGSSPHNQNLTFLFNCNHSRPSKISHHFSCPKTKVTSEGFYVEAMSTDLIHLCKARISVPFRQISSVDLGLGSLNNERGLVKGFMLVYKEDLEANSLCVKHHGQCGYNWTEKQPICFYRQSASQPLALYDDKKFRNCSNPFECGPINVTYPFWGNGRIQDCGRPGFELKCQDNYTVIEAKLERYRVLQINQDNRIITIVRMDIFSDGCTLEGIPFSSAPKNPNLTFLFNCSQSPSLISYNFNCSINNVTSEGFYVEESARSDLFQLCKKRILVPFHQVPFEDPQLGLPKEKGFKLEYEEEDICPFCFRTQGQCGYDWTTNDSICFYLQPKGMPAFFLNFISSSSI